MKKKLTFKDWIKCLNDNRIALLIIVIVVILIWQFVFFQLTALTSDEMMNFAIGVYAWTDNPLDAKLQSALEEDGIKQVTMGYFDASNVDGLSSYLSTYGLNESDIFLIDTAIAGSLLYGCMAELSQSELTEMCKDLGFTPETVTENGKTIGFIVHKKGNEQYNKQFAALHSTMLFAADGEEYDFALYINNKTVHKELAVKAISLFLKEIQ